MYINYPCILGRFREYGADVELICEFPRGTNIVSNIVWERVPSSPGDRLVNSAGKFTSQELTIVQNREFSPRRFINPRFVLKTVDTAAKNSLSSPLRKYSNCASVNTKHI